MAIIDHLDHLVLTCIDKAATRHFYTEVLQMKLEALALSHQAAGLIPAADSQTHSTGLQELRPVRRD